MKELGFKMGNRSISIKSLRNLLHVRPGAGTQMHIDVIHIHKLAVSMAG